MSIKIIAWLAETLSERHSLCLTLGRVGLVMISAAEDVVGRFCPTPGGCDMLSLQHHFSDWSATSHSFYDCESPTLP